MGHIFHGDKQVVCYGLCSETSYFTESKDATDPSLSQKALTPPIPTPLIGCSLLLWYQTSDAEASCATSVLVQQEVVEWSDGECNLVTNEADFHSV